MTLDARTLFYIGLNFAAGIGIVLANKAIYVVFEFNFPYALTLTHLVFTVLGMRLLCQAGFFEMKSIPARNLQDLAASYVGYVVLGNVSLRLNPVGFYQITKILIAPAVMVLEAATDRKLPSLNVLAAVVLLSVGIAVATVSDTQVMSNTLGIAVGLASVLSTALYNFWAASKQKCLEVGSAQLVHQFSPYAAGVLGCLVPLLEPVGWTGPVEGSLVGYKYTTPAVLTIVASAALGLVVALSTFLVIGSTSALTFNVLGHVKTAAIVLGGCVFFQEVMPWQKMAGLALAVVGIVWYTHIKMTAKPTRTVHIREPLVATTAGVASTKLMDILPKWGQVPIEKELLQNVLQQPLEPQSIKVSSSAYGTSLEDGRRANMTIKAVYM